MITLEKNFLTIIWCSLDLQLIAITYNYKLQLKLHDFYHSSFRISGDYSERRKNVDSQSAEKIQTDQSVENWPID